MAMNVDERTIEQTAAAESDVACSSALRAVCGARGSEHRKKEIMKIVTQCALSGAFFGLALACANPVEVTGCSQNQANSNCDVILAAPSDFGADAGISTGSDASVSDGLVSSSAGSNAGGSSSAELGSGNRPPLQQTGGAGGNTGMTSGTATGNAGTNAGGAAGASAAGAGGAAATAGAGGASGGAGGASGGAPGTAGTSGTAGTTGTAGAGAVSNPNFDVASCDFTVTTGCDALNCATACPANMGSYCTDNCPKIVTCVSTAAEDPTASSCITAADPLCAQRTNGTAKACTTVVENGGNQTNPTQPSAVARAFVECICSKPRPAQ